MALSLIKEVDEITVSFNGIVMVREVRKVMQANVVISEGYHRYSLSPGEDVSNEPEKVQRLCHAVWTPEVIASFKEQTLPVAVPTETN
jgi:hypothetical protein